MTRSRRQISGAEKAAVVRRHLIDKVPVSDLCDELGLQPTQIYTWQKQLFENGEAAFDRPSRKTKQESAKDQKIAGLEAKLQKKNEVVAELLEEHVQLKKDRNRSRKSGHKESWRFIVGLICHDRIV